MPGEIACGDIPWVKKLGNITIFALIDVAGHGPAANEHAESCLYILEKYYTEDLTSIIKALHKFSHGKKGLVIGIALIDAYTGIIQYSGIGNIRARILGIQKYRFVARTGTVGVTTPHPIIEEYLLNNGDVFLMYSDGISDQFEKNDYPQIITDAIETIPKKIINKFSKNNDDMSCIAARYNYD